MPIFKGGDHSDMKNYHPISILSTISKVFEKVFHAQLYKYFEGLNILFPHQYGFWSGRSTVQSCSNLLRYVYSRLDKGDNVLSVFMNIQKAFDSVNHSILSKKLHYYGVRVFLSTIGYGHICLTEYSMCILMGSIPMNVQ